MIDVNVLAHYRRRTLVTAFKHLPPLTKLGVLLSVLLSEFPYLSLHSDDTYFYCLAIYENLVELGEGEYIAHGAPPQFAQEARERVKMHMQTLPEAPDLTDRVVRLDSSAFAIGGYSSVWRGRLPFATPDDPNGSLRVAIKVLRASHTKGLTGERERKLFKVVLSHNCAMDVLFIIGHSVCIEK
ncbi:hypothetical protein BS47DRAFT_539475 [Hydnum rufescens UP504]|uniref:Uncharacterized protein n=1 Tax=Hydnum rufescens UP504 TaxID=1448309 RepID=A0A9P6DNP2_9AGAM|nr:hypothetical protein BS47DRAFT_539475 [Hydnum rufescens UP504]